MRRIQFATVYYCTKSFQLLLLLAVLTCPVCAAAQTWMTAGNLGGARALHSATLLGNGKVLVAGGFNGNSALNTATLYDPANNSWSVPANNLATARFAHAALLLVDGRVLISGGKSGAGSTNVIADTEIYDPATQRWSRAAPMASARFGHSATLLTTGPHAGKVLVVGGDTGTGVTGSAELYDATLNQWNTAPAMGRARDNHGAVRLSDGRVLVVGGHNGSQVESGAEIYDSTTNSWSTVSRMASARENHLALLLTSGKLIVAGGHNGGSALSSAEIYDPANNSWSAADSLNSAREKHVGVVLADGRVLVAGGQNGSGTLASAELYDPVNNSWSLLPSMNAARENLTATWLGLAYVLVAGGDDGTATGFLSSAEMFTTQLSQTINFNALSNKTLGTAPFALNASATSGLPVIFSATGPCTVVGSTVTLTGAGTCVLTAVQPGNTSYAAASSVQRSFTIATSSAVFGGTTSNSTGLSRTPQRAAESAAAPMISLAYFGKARDRVGRGDVFLAPDSDLDLVFTATLNAGSGNRALTRLVLTTSAGDSWNTQAPDLAWVLGAATDLDAAFLNATNAAVNYSWNESTSIKLFAADRGIPANGLMFTLTATFADGSTATATTPVKGPALIEFGFTKETVATFDPFTSVGLAFASDGRLFVWQKSGIVRIVKNGAVLPTPFLNFQNRVNSCGDRGLLGLALDPNFASNRYVYLLYVHEPAGNFADCGAKFSRVTRVTADATDGDVVLAGSEVVILDGIPVDVPSHSVGTLRFAPDGKLFVSHGDGANYVDVLALRAQDLNTYNGKVLRINPDGTAPSDNPFYDGTNSIRSKVWAYGMRNPFRFGLHPITGEPYIGDVGLSSWEEVNRGRGANFGWPCYEGPSPQPSYQAIFEQCRQLPSSAITAPLITYGRLGGRSIIGGAFYTGSLYPTQYRNNFFIADYSSQWVARMVFDASDNLVGVYDFAANIDGPVAIEMGPDGMLYYVALNSGEVGRFRYTGNQQPPIAISTATPAAGYSPLTVNFSGSSSFDPKGGSLTYLWDFGDGATSTSADVQHTYTASGVVNFTARLTVTDNTAQSAAATQVVTVGNLPPVASITAPAEGTLVLPGQTVTFQGSAFDPEEGALAPSALSWTVLLHHNEHVHPHVTATGTGGSFFAPDHGEGSFRFEVILTAVDSNGLRHTKSIFLPMPTVGTPDVVAAYSYNEGFGTTLYDTSGNANHGTIVNGTWTSQSHFNKALQFDGTSGFVSVPYNPGLNLASAGTLETWVKLGTLGRFHSLIAKGAQNDPLAHQYALEITDSNRARCSLANGSAGVSLDSLSAIPANEFRHVACTWNGTTISLYINGALDASVAQTLAPASNNAPLFLGQYGGAVKRLLGVIDETRIYNRALNETEIRFDMNAPIVSTSNIAPTITSIAAKTATTGIPIGPFDFAVGDLETPAADLVVSATSSNQSVVPNGNIVLGGGGVSRTVSLISVPGQTGTVTITLSVFDGQATTSTSFQVTVNGPPTISVSPNVAAAGSTVTVTWSGIPAPTGTDWIGLYSLGAVDTSYRDWVYVSCNRTAAAPVAAGSCNFPLNTALPVGNYEFRFLLNDAFNVIAVSNSLTVAGNLPVVTIATTGSSTVSEAASASAGFTVTRSGATTAPVTVNYTVGGTATNGVDYLTLTGSVTLAAAASSAPIALTPIDDSLFEGNESVIVSLNPSANYTIGLPASASITIVDDETASLPVVTVSASANATEPSTSGQFTVSRIGSTTNSLTVKFTVSGSATASLDYASIGTTVSIPAGSATTSLTVNVIDDSIYEGAETVIVTLDSDISYTVGNPSSATMTIADNEPPPAAATLSVSPGGASRGDLLTLTWSGIANPSALDWIGMYAAGAANSSYLTWFYVSCGQGATQPKAAGACNLVVPAVAANGTYEFRLLSNNLFNLIAVSNPLIVGLPLVNVAATANAAEPSTHGQFTVTRSGSTANPLTVNFAVSGTATANSDYTAIGTPVVIAAGSAATTVAVNVIDDTVYEGSETIVVTLSAHPTYIVGAEPSATLTIADNDKPVVTIAATDTIAAETGLDTGMFTISRDGTTAAALTVNYTLSGTATNSVDYQPLSGSVTIPVGQSSATLAVTPINDSLFEGSETVIVTLSGSTNYVVGNPSAATVTITDDDKPVVTIVASDTAAAEAALDPGVFTISRDGITTAALTVNYTLSGTATNGVDYQPLSGSITIPVGQTAAPLVVTPIDDSLFEGSETVIVTLSGSSNYGVGNPGTATVTITDDDKPVVTIVASDAAAAEAALDPGVFTISRDGITTAPLTVNYSITGTATNGVDYQTLSGNLTVAAGQASANIVVAPIDDPLFEGSETVIVTLSANANYIIGNPNSATVTIADNEAPSLLASPGATLPGSSVTAAWNGIVNPSATDWIGLFAQASGNGSYLTWVYVNCFLNPTVARASGSCPITVPANLANGVYELRLFSNDGFNVITASNAFTVGNAVVLPSVTITAVSHATEPATHGSFTASRTGSTASPLTVNFTVGGNATPGSDYTNLGNSFEIPANASSVSLPVNVLDDTIAEGAETVIVTLSVNSNYSLGNPNTATVTISDNDAASLGPAVVSATPNPIIGGGNLIVSWNGIANPTPRDWLGLFRPGTSNYTIWTYVNCSHAPGAAVAAGSCALFVSPALAAGTYEVRMLANDGFGTLAVSTPITVQ